MKITINKPVEYEAKYLKVDAGVLYWENGYINGIEDVDCDETGGGPQMPCAECIKEQNRIICSQDWRWRPLIDIDTGRIVN